MNATEKESGNEIMVDPNDVVLNAAGTNMTVATYSEKSFNVGNRRPSYQSIRSINFLPENEEIMKTILNQEIVKQKKQKKQKKLGLRDKRQARRA